MPNSCGRELNGADRFVRFRAPGETRYRWGRLEEGEIEALSGAPWRADARRTADRFAEDEVALGPAAEPTKIIALGYNFRDLFLDSVSLSRREEPHFADAGFEPLVFLKAPNSLSAHGWPIVKPDAVSEMWVEVEIAAVLGRSLKGARSRDDARDAVFGVTIANDVSATNIAGRDWHLARSKSLDGFCPVGPFLVHAIDEAPLDMSTFINGRRTQHASSDNRVLDTLDAVAFVSRLMTLEPGDLVLTGTPRGGRQSVVAPGDVVTVEIEGLGRLVNPVVAAPATEATPQEATDDAAVQTYTTNPK
jgi:2-keto-4-pentenoate hydratase/2-oxohepta-3-ene-1,7-dioic acid hydratase in catechol pathway